MAISTLQAYIQKIKDLVLYQKRYPHKPFLLLIIIEMIEQGEIWENNISFREIYENKKPFFADLIEIANEHGSLKTELKPNIHNPFFHLKTDGFWDLYPTELRILKKIRLNQLLNANPSAKLNDRFFLLLTDPEYREIIRQTILALLNTRFPDIQQKVENVIEEHRMIKGQQIEKDIEGYSEQLISNIQHPFATHREIESIDTESPVRSAGFRRAIMKIYEYTCAVCELNIRVSSGASITDAAHIIPFSVSYNDDIRNGMSLCKSHHWAFDTGLISVNEAYQIVVSRSVTEQGPTASILEDFRDKEIWLPGEPEHRPAQNALMWHRENVLRH